MTEHNHIHVFIRIFQILYLCLPEKILPVHGPGNRLKEAVRDFDLIDFLTLVEYVA